MTTRPPIGVPRVYAGDTIPILYPGEQASGTVCLTEQRPGVRVPVTGWLVEPAPGFHNWWLRTRWRVVGRFVHSHG